VRPDICNVTENILGKMCNVTEKILGESGHL